MYPSVKAKSDREKKRRLELTEKLNELSDRVFRLHPEFMIDHNHFDDEKQPSFACLKNKNVNRTDLLKVTTSLLLKLHEKCKTKGNTISQLKRKESALLSITKRKTKQRKLETIKDVQIHGSSSKLSDDDTKIVASKSSFPLYRMCPDTNAQEKVHRAAIDVGRMSTSVCSIESVSQNLGMNNMQLQNPALLPSLSQHRRNILSRLEYLGTPSLRPDIATEGAFIRNRDVLEVSPDIALLMGFNSDFPANILNQFRNNYKI